MHEQIGIALGPTGWALVTARKGVDIPDGTFTPGENLNVLCEGLKSPEQVEQIAHSFVRMGWVDADQRATFTQQDLREALDG